MTYTKNFDQFTAFGKDTVEAYVKSGTIAVNGLKSLADTYQSLATQSVEQAKAAVTALSAVKTPAEMQNLTVSLTKSNIETAVAEGRKLQSQIEGIVTESIAPLKARFDVASSLFKAA